MVRGGVPTFLVPKLTSMPLADRRVYVDMKSPRIVRITYTVYVDMQSNTTLTAATWPLSLARNKAVLPNFSLWFTLGRGCCSVCE